METYKLDALVAEKIMGWPVIPIQEWNENGSIQCVVLIDKNGRTRTQIGLKMWQPSGNITATFEALQHAGVSYQLTNNRPLFGYNDYVAHLWDERDRHWMGKGDTMPLAICSALLEMVRDKSTWPHPPPP